MLLPVSTRLATCATALALFALPSSAPAQSINFDYSVNDGGGPWIGAPADTFGGYHGQTGHWIHSGPFISYTNMAGLDGNPTTADLTISGGGPVYFWDHASLSGNTEVLMGDWRNADPGDPITLTFSGLFRGVYTVYTYSNNLWCDTCRTNVAVVPSIDVVQTVGGPLTNNTLTQGLNYARHRVNCTSGTIIVGVSAQTTRGSFNGIQLVYHGAVPLPADPIMHVDQDAAAPGGGLNWLSPCVRLEDALTVAQVAGGVEQIWVAEGSYRPTRNGNRNDSFVIPDGVKVYGGFAGNETALNQRDVDANPTTLSGAINSPLIAGDNCYHVVDLTNTTAATRLDGFRISNGYASGAGSDSFGGGLYMSGSSATVRNCSIVSNHATLGGGAWSSGNSPDFVDCLFLDNDADDHGGGVRIINGTQTASFFNCRFAGNDAGGNGGGASMSNQAAWFVNCAFTGNTSVLEGAGIHGNGEDADVALFNTTLANNSSGDTCGGVYTAAGADMDIVNSILWGNSDGDILTNTRQAQYFSFDGSSTQAIDYTIVHGWNIVAGVGNNGSNPLFGDLDGTDNVIGTLDDSVRVQITSPAIDSGSNNDLPLDAVDLDGDGVFFEFISLDLDRDARRADVASVADSGNGTAPIVDRGPYEAVTPCPADINGDDLVNVNDLLAVISSWGATGPNPADINGDSIVDVNDLLAVVSAWGVCP